MADALPIGYQFSPSEEQLFSYCLARRVRGESVFPEFIREFDVYEKEPWEFYDKNVEKSLYVFTKLKKKKSRVERMAGSGCWKGVKTTDIKNCHGPVLGHKKHFNFKVKDGSSFDSQNADKGSWIMHEYSMLNKEIVLCKIRFKKEESGGKQGTTLVINMPIGIGENHRLKDSSDFNNKIDVPHQDINVEPSNTMCLGPPVMGQQLYCMGSNEDVWASVSHPRLAISAQTTSGIMDCVGGRRPMEQTFMDNATSNGVANLLASTIMPIKIGENHRLKDSHDFNNKIDVPCQDINVEPSNTMCLGPQVKRQRLYCTGSEEDVWASASFPCLAISAQTTSGIKNFVGGTRPMEQSFMDNATSNGAANLLASTIMEEDTDDGDGCQWILDTISFD